MKRHPHRAIIRFVLACALGIASAASAQGDPFAPYSCGADDRACKLSAMRSHAARKMATWAADIGQPIADRVHVAPPHLVEYLNLDNALNRYPERPRAANPDEAFMRDVRDAVRELPPRVLQALAPNLVGIYLLDDLGGTGYTDAVFDAKGNAAGGYIVLDAAVLARHTANAWATWKENTPFKPDPAWQLKALIEREEGDIRRNAIQYILLHEMGHVLSIGADVHPPHWEDPREHVEGRAWPFFDLTWFVDRAANTYRPYPPHAFAQRSRVAYYFGAKLEGAEMLPTYEALERTSFPTLYAATRPADDFAESFVKYVHVKLMGRPWEITLWRDGAKVKTIGACWGTPRCAAKEALLDSLLGTPR